MSLKGAALLVAAVAGATVLPGSASTQPAIAIFGQNAACSGQEIAPVNGVYAVHRGCTVNLQVTWPDGLVGARPQASADGGETWVESTISTYPPVTPGLVSGLGIDACDWPGPGRWIFRVHGVDVAGADLYSDPFPFAVSACVQRFLGYAVDRESPDFSGGEMQLTDRFGTEVVYVGDARMLLTAVEPIHGADANLKCYRLTGGRRLDATVEVSNELAERSSLLIKEPNRFCTSAAVGPDGAALELPSEERRFKCYRVEDVLGLEDQTVELVDQFGALRTVVRRAELLCAAVASGDNHLVCYGIRELEPFAPRRVFTLDALGLQSVRVFDPLTLCVPSTT